MKGTVRIKRKYKPSEIFKEWCMILLEDYNALTMKLPEEKVSDEDVLASVKMIAESGMFCQ